MIPRSWDLFFHTSGWWMAAVLRRGLENLSFTFGSLKVATWLEATVHTMLSKLSRHDVSDSDSECSWSLHRTHPCVPRVYAFCHRSSIAVSPCFRIAVHFASELNHSRPRSRAACSPLLPNCSLVDHPNVKLHKNLYVCDCHVHFHIRRSSSDGGRRHCRIVISVVHWAFRPVRVI